MNFFSFIDQSDTSAFWAGIFISVLVTANMAIIFFFFPYTVKKIRLSIFFFLLVIFLAIGLPIWIERATHMSVAHAVKINRLVMGTFGALSWIVGIQRAKAYYKVQRDSY
jgi:hypothetical protein